MDILAQSGQQAKHRTMTDTRDGKQIRLKITDKPICETSKAGAFLLLFFLAVSGVFVDWFRNALRRHTPT